MKALSCTNCWLYEGRGPMEGFFTSPTIDVLFLGHAPINRYWFNSFPLLQEAITRIGLRHYGISDCWKCIIRGGKQTNADISLHDFCRTKLAEEINLYHPKVVVPIGAAAFEILTPDKNWLYKEPGIVKRKGKLALLPIPHPELIDREKRWKGVWDASFDGIANFLTAS